MADGLHWLCCTGLLHLSHVAFHANLVPLIGMLALTALLSALKGASHKKWLLTGLFTGLLAYTYTAGHGWTLILLAFMGFHLLRFTVKWRVILPAIGLALLLAVPVYLSIVSTPAQDGGLSRTLIPNLTELGRECAALG